MRYYSEDTVRSIIKSTAHTALEQSSNFADAMLQNRPCIEIEEPHGRLIDMDDLTSRAYAIQRRDRISFPEAIALALTEIPFIVKAS